MALAPHTAPAAAGGGASPSSPGGTDRHLGRQVREEGGAFSTAGSVTAGQNHPESHFPPRRPWREEGSGRARPGLPPRPLRDDVRDAADVPGLLRAAAALSFKGPGVSRKDAGRREEDRLDPGCRGAPPGSTPTPQGHPHGAPICIYCVCKRNWCRVRCGGRAGAFPSVDADREVRAARAVCRIRGPPALSWPQREQPGPSPGPLAPPSTVISH